MAETTNEVRTTESNVLAVNCILLDMISIILDRTSSETNGKFRLIPNTSVSFLPASPKAKAGLGVQSLRPSVCPSVRPKILSSQLLWNYWSNYHETWYVDRTTYVVMHSGKKFWSPHFCGIKAPWNLENTHKWPCHRNSSETILIRFS